MPAGSEVRFLLGTVNQRNTEMALIARVTTAVLTVLAACAGVVVLSAPAQAEDGYKYWGYYLYEDGRWVGATKGADSLTPEDGALEGWHFAVTTTKPDRPPRTDATFQDICAGTEAGQGEKRVAVALDYGTAAEADEGDQPPKPEAVCAVVRDEATGQQVLESVAQVRVEDGLTCAVNGYPAAGCGEPVSDVRIPQQEANVDFRMPAEGSQQSAATGEDMPWSLAGVGAVVVVLGGGAVLMARRRRA